MTRPRHLAAVVVAVLLAAAAVGTARADGPADPFEVPNGNAAQLLAFIQNTASKKYDQEGVAKARQAIIKAASKIIAGKCTDNELFNAVNWKAQLLDPKDAEAFENELKRAGKGLAAQMVHGATLLKQLHEAKDDLKGASREDRGVRGSSSTRRRCRSAAWAWRRQSARPSIASTTTSSPARPTKACSTAWASRRW